MCVYIYIYTAFYLQIDNYTSNYHKVPEPRAPIYRSMYAHVHIHIYTRTHVYTHADMFIPLTLA